MLHAIFLSLTLALQSQGAARPAAPIAVAPSGSPEASADVPAELARLTGPDTVAVVFVPDVAGLQQALDRLSSVGGPTRTMLPGPSEVRQLLRRAVRTDLEIPLAQPALWWADMATTDGDEPPMGLEALVLHQAFRIPGASEAAEKARAAADPKSRPSMPVRARDRRAAVTVLPGDLVVFSSDGEPVVMPAADKTPSELLTRLPRGQACGRVDLARMLAENADQLRMAGGFATMAMGGPGGVPPDASEEVRRRAEMRQAVAEGAGRQISDAVEALLQLKRASFALDLQGDELMVWADWTRDAAFPAGLDQATVNTLAGLLPAGLDAYAGASTNALDVVYADRFRMDDVLATMGDSPQQREAWESATGHMRAAVALVDGGVVGGVSGSVMSGEPNGAVVAFRVKDMAAFRRELEAAGSDLTKAGLADVKLQSAADRMEWTAVPDAGRVRQIAQLTGDAPEAIDAMVARATQPLRVSMSLSGSQVLATYARGDGAQPAAPAATDGADLRDRLVQGGGASDWFVTLDVRGMVRRLADTLAMEDARKQSPEMREEVRRQLAVTCQGPPVPVRARQAVLGNTARLSLAVNLADLKALTTQLEALDKSMRAGKGADADDDDDDDEEAKEAKGRRGADDGT